MNMNKIWIYGIDEDNDVVKTMWLFNHVSDAQLELIAKRWKAHYGCTRVFAMMDSKELKDSWFDYMKTRHSKHGTGEFNKVDFIDYLESGDWELAVA